MSGRTFSRARSNIVVLALVLAGLCLRWIFLGRSSLWFDEGYTAWLVSLPAGQIVRNLRVDTAPPFFYLLLRSWAVLFGRDEFALRSFSAACASISLVIFYPLALRILRDRWAAIVALALFAVSVLQVAYAHDARFYALMTLLAEVDLFLVLLVIQRPTIWRYLGLIIAWALSLYTNNMMGIYLLALAGAWLVLAGERTIRKRVLDVVVVSLGAATLYSPWIPILLAQSHALKGAFWIERPSLETLIRTLAVLAGVNDQGVGGWEFERISLACAIFFVFVVAGFMSRQTIRRATALGIFGLLPVFGVFLYSQIRQSIFVDRAFIPSSLIAPLIVALPFTSPVLRRGWIVISATVLVLIPSVLSLRENYVGEHRENWREVCNYIQARPVRRRLVVFVANEGELLYDYYARSGNYAPSSEMLGVPAEFFAIDPPRTMRRVRSEDDLAPLRAVLSGGGFDEVDLVESHYWWSDDGHLTLGFLEKQMVPIGEVEIDRIIVHQFEPGSRAAANPDYSPQSTRRTQR